MNIEGSVMLVYTCGGPFYGIFAFECDVIKTTRLAIGNLSRTRYFAR